jgi:peptide/nickel transport system substrate-binding protein
VRHFRLQAVGGAATAVAVTVLAAACSSSTSSGSAAGPSSSTSSTASSAASGSATGGAVNPGTGTPQKGGTLNEVGVSDVQYMDYDTAYYSTDDQVMRLTVRQLYTWGNTPATVTTPEPDLATGAPVVSNGGKTVKVTIRSGVMWDTTPARAVTAADVVRGIKRACNPSPIRFNGMSDFEGTIAGLTAFCNGYPKAASSSAAVMKQYIETHNVSGITTSGNTITFQLTGPAAWLEGAMTLAPFSAVPIEAESALPGTPGVYNHMYSDGPYTISSYTPAKSIHFVRNPDWNASTDPLRKAYVNAINVDETGNQTTIYQQISTNSPSLGLTWDSLPPPADDVSLYNQYKSGSDTVSLNQTFGSNPYIVFNTVSPNNSGALKNATVRQALSYGIDRLQLQKTLGGEQTNPALTHILPPGTDGAQDIPANYNPYPYNQAKATQMLTSAGFTPSHKLTLKYLYRSDSQGGTKLFVNLQSQLDALGNVNVVGVPTNQSDFYGKYLSVSSTPTPASQGVWDFTGAGWSPDWYGNGSLTWFNPLFLSPGGFPTQGGSNFGYFSSPTVNADITNALAQTTEAAADQYWAKADMATMAAAAVYPITATEEFAVHAAYVHNAVYIPQMQQYDAANVWLSNS